MSLRVRAIANSMTVAVNENVTATIKTSTGYTIAPDGTQIPSYAVSTRVLQLQSMESDDLEHFGFANQQGMFMIAYGNEMVGVIDRDTQLGNTLIETPKYGSDLVGTWQVMKIAESYNDWVKFIIRYMGAKKPLELNTFGFEIESYQPFDRGVFHD